jgi:trimethylamine--corrinoid protein Co-methyltransferase
LALDAIQEVGPGGEFLTSNHTLKFCRYEKWSAAIDSGAAGLMNNHKDMMDWLQEKKNALLAAYRQPELADDVRTDMEKYLVDAGFDIENLS